MSTTTASAALDLIRAPHTDSALPCAPLPLLIGSLPIPGLLLSCP